jgi:hypothetical protein
MQRLVRGCIVARGRPLEDVIGPNRKFLKDTFMKQILATALILAAFFHYWGRGRANDLASAVKGGLLVGRLHNVSSPVQD